jgi:hypothetical protein
MGAIMRTNGAGVADYLALAADAIEKGSEHEGQCASCGMVGNYDHHDDHAPHCLVREIRALLAGHEDEHEAEHPRCVATGVPLSEGWKKALAATRSLSPDERRRSLRWAALEDDGQPPTAGPADYFDVARKAIERARRAFIADMDTISRQQFEPPAETFAVIRCHRKAWGLGCEVGAVAVVNEANWLWENPTSDWEPLARGIPTREMAQSIAQALSSRPFSE